MVPINGSTGALQGLVAQRRPVGDLDAHGQGHRLRGVRCAERQLRRDLPGAQRRRGRRDRRDRAGSTASHGGGGSTANNTTDRRTAAPTFPKVRDQRLRPPGSAAGACSRSGFKAKKTAKFTLVINQRQGQGHARHAQRPGRKAKGKNGDLQVERARQARQARKFAGTYRFKVTALAGKAEQTVKGSVKVIAAKR